MIIINLMDTKKVKRKGFSALWVASLALMMQIQSLCAMDERKENNAFAPFRQHVDQLLMPQKEVMHLDQLNQLLKSNAFRDLVVKDRNEAKRYKKLVISVNTAKVSPQVQQALAKKLLLKTSDELSKNETNFTQSLNSGISRIIKKEEEKAKRLLLAALKQQAEQLSFQKEVPHFQKIKNLMASAEFLEMKNKYAGEAEKYRQLLISIGSSKLLSPEIKQALAKKMLQKTLEELREGETIFTQSLSREINLIRKKQEEKEKRLLMAALKQQVEQLFTQRVSYLDKLEALLILPEFTEMGKNNKTEEDAYKKLVESVKTAKVPSEIKQALAKKLLQMTLEALSESETNFTQSLSSSIHKIIERETLKQRKIEEVQKQAFIEEAQRNKMQRKTMAKAFITKQTRDNISLVSLMSGFPINLNNIPVNLCDQETYQKTTVYFCRVAFVFFEIPENSMANQVTKAYYKMAMEYHPDKASNDPLAEEKFKEISSAYQYITLYQKYMYGEIPGNIAQTLFEGW